MASLQKQLMITPYTNDDILKFNLADMEKYVYHLLEPGRLLNGMSADLLAVFACMYSIFNTPNEQVFTVKDKCISSHFVLNSSPIDSCQS